MRLGRLLLEGQESLELHLAQAVPRRFELPPQAIEHAPGLINIAPGLLDLAGLEGLSGSAHLLGRFLWRVGLAGLAELAGQVRFLAVRVLLQPLQQVGQRPGLLGQAALLVGAAGPRPRLVSAWLAFLPQFLAEPLLPACQFTGQALALRQPGAEFRGLEAGHLPGQPLQLRRRLSGLLPGVALAAVFRGLRAGLNTVGGRIHPCAGQVGQGLVLAGHLL